MARKHSNDYFDMMREAAVVGHEAARRLEQILHNFTPETLQAGMAEMHEVEHRGDDMKHTLVGKLVKEFITPIEREDIMALADQIDDVTDTVEDVLLKMYMYNIQAVRPEALTFAELIVRCADGLVTMFDEFADFKKSKKIHDAIVEINRLEEEGDRLYISAVRGLHEGETSALEAAAWTEVYTCLERCCDTCEHTADLVENVILKNS